MSDLLITDGTVVIGDGKTTIPKGYVLVRDGMIVAIGDRSGPAEAGARVVHASGQIVMPGVINTHAHGCSPGPLNPIGSPPLSEQNMRAQLDRHLAGGETTVLCVCGFCLPKAALAKDHPVRVCLATSHTPANFRAADLVDGRGLMPEHRAATVERSLDEGAVAIGEIGAGHTLGGNGQDYMLIPQAIERATGVRIRVDQARELRWAILGKSASPAAFDPEKTVRSLHAAGLSEKLTLQEAREIIEKSVMPPIAEALRGFEEAAFLSAKTGKRAVMHNSPVSVKEIARLAERYPAAKLVAGHSNQQDFEIEEAIDWAKRLRSQGVVVDISTWDSPGKALHARPDTFIKMLAADVVDTVSTDFAGGEWEPILKGLAMAIKAKAVDVTPALALATGNPARLFPEVADGRGLLAPGKVADVVLADAADVGAVRTVIIRGEIVIEDGQLAGRHLH